MVTYRAIVVVGLFGLTIIGLIRYPNYPERVFGILFLVLYVTGLVSTHQVMSSLFNQGLMTLILLIACSVALEKTKLLHSISHSMISPRYGITWIRLYLLAVFASAFFNNTAVVSTMIAPLRHNRFHAASRLLLPLSYAAIFGGTLTLVGTSTNLLVNSMVMGVAQPPLHFFDFTLVGCTVVIGCGVVLYVVSHWLPDYPNLTAKVSDYCVDIEVQNTSSLVGKSLEKNGLRNLESLFLVEIVRHGRLISPVSPQEPIEAGDRLIFSGEIRNITLLEQFDGVSTFAGQNGLPMNNLTEVIIRPDSMLLGQTLKHAGFRALFDAAVVGIRRDGERVSGKLGNVILRAGDYLILAVGDDFHSRKNINKNFYILNETIKPTHILKGFKEKFTIIGFFSIIGLSAAGYVPLFKGALIFLGLLVMSGCLTSNEIQRRLPKQIWTIIAAALLMSCALSNSGALSLIEQFVRAHQQAITPLSGLVLVYVLTWLMTELVTNNAAAALIFPIAYGLAISLHLNPIAYELAVAFAASASFISPYGYQTNLMVYSAGQYKLSDFVRIGIPISAMYAVCVIGTLTILYL